MARLVAIVEGHGEVEAVPLLIRRIGQEVSPLSTPDVVKPIRVPRGSMLKTGELDRYVSLAGIRVGSDGRILILLDAHRDCPAELRTTILKRARATRSDLPIEVVLANREYESWFIAAVESLRGVRGYFDRYGRTARSRVDPGSQGVAPRQDDWILSSNSRSSSIDRPFRHGAGASARSLVR